MVRFLPVQVKPHPDETATQLYVLTVDCGETEETAAKEAASAKPAQVHVTLLACIVPSYTSRLFRQVASAGAGAEGAKRRGKGDEKKAAEHKPHVGPRTIVSGLRAHYQPADLLGKLLWCVRCLIANHAFFLPSIRSGKHVVVVTNIKAAEIK